MLFAALAPSISHAMARARGATWAEICSVGGVRLVKLNLPAGAGEPAKQGVIHLEHCPFCATHAGSFALLPPSRFSLQVSDNPAFYPRLFYQSPRPLPAWTAAQSRAPPAKA